MAVPLRKGRLNLAALIALFGLFFQALLPLAQVIPPVNNGNNLTGQIVICSAFGTKIIDTATGAEVPDDQEDPGRQSDSSECVICLVFAAGDNALANACEIDALELSGRLVAFQVSPQETPKVRFQNGAHGARAPPVV